MIDLAAETTIPLSDAPKHLPAKNGKRIHLATVYRWIMRGVQGVKLESLKVGGGRVTSVEALQRFAERLSSDGAPISRSTRQRERAGDKAERELAEIGI